MEKIFNSIKSGIIDVPYSPHIINNNEVVTVRDKNKNIRIIKRGKLPISDRCFEYEKISLWFKQRCFINSKWYYPRYRNYAMSQNKLLIDVGSTYFKVCANNQVEQHFRDFNKDIFDDLSSKCGDTISKFKKMKFFICSSANGGLTTLIIGVTNSFH